MYYLHNMTDGDLSLRFGGRYFPFPAHSVTPIDSDDMAREFNEKTYLPPNLALGRKGPSCSLVRVDEVPKGVRVVAPLLFLDPVPVEEIPPVTPTPIVTAPPVHSFVATPRDEKAALSELPFDVLILATRKHGCFKKGDVRQQMVDKLHAAGFRAP